MKVKVVGIRKVDFPDINTGMQITGYTLYCLKEDKHVVGFEGKKFFIKSSIDITGLKVNDVVDILFNERGKVESLTISKM